jgi:hypothetical protein
MNDDFTDLLELLLGAGARFLVVGAHAMAVHGVPRATGDLDVWIDREPANASKVWDALKRFGAPVEQLGLTRAHLETPGNVAQIGVPPRRIDLLTSITGVEFDEAWRSRVVQKVRDLEVPFLGRADLIKNKRALESLGEEP